MVVWSSAGARLLLGISAVCTSVLAACGSTAAQDDVIALIDSRPEPPGASCPGGGTAVLAGPDRDHSGTLDPGEVEHTTYLCQPVRDTTTSHEEINGSITIRSPADAARYADLRRLTGDLTINTSGPLVLPALEEVGGSIYCQTLTGGTLELPRLTRVGVDFRNNGFPLPVIPVLESVGHILDLDGHGAPLHLDHLRTVYYAHLTSADVQLPVLETAFGLEVEGPPTVRLPKLARVDDWLNVPASRRIELPSLETARELWLSNDTEVLVAPLLREANVGFGAATAAIDLPSLEKGNIGVYGTALTAFALPRLAEGSLTIQGNPALSAIDLPAYTSGGQIDVRDNPALATLRLPALVSANWFDLRELRGIELPALERCSSLLLLDSPDLEVELPALREMTDSIQIGSDGARSLDLPVLTSVVALYVRDNTTLTRVTAPMLVTASNVTFTNNPQLPTCMATAIATQTGAPGEIFGNGDGSCP